MRSSTRTWIVPVAVVLLLAGCTSDDGWNADRFEGGPATPTTTPAEWLFVAQSEGDTTFDPATGVLSLPASSVQAFTDRPHRDTRAISPEQFVSLWQATGPDSFRADPPNAVLTYWEVDGDDQASRSVVCEIVGDVSYSASGGRLDLGLRVLEPKGATLPATIARASLFVDGDPNFGAGCPDSVGPDDQTNVEYFNMMNFDGEFTLQVERVASANEYQIWLDCPERESPSIPPSTFDVQLSIADGSSPVSCYASDRLTIAASDLGTTPFCSRGGACTVEVVALNSEKDGIYSTTKLTVQVGSDESIVPELVPATLPICPNAALYGHIPTS